MKSSWFRLNKWRTGWMPITWQGWTLTILYFGFTVYNFIRISNSNNSLTETLIDFIPQTILFTGFYSVLCFLTAEKTSSRDMLK